MKEITTSDVIMADETSDDSGRFPRVRKLGRTVQEDYKDSANKLRTWAIGSVLVGSQVADRARIVILTVPPAVIETMEQTNNSLTAGAVGAGMFAVWSLLVGESTLRGVDEFPKTVETVNEELPAMVNFFADALPGVEKGGPKPEDSDSPTHSVLSRIGMRARRSTASISFGTSPFVATARATGYNSKEARRLYTNTGLDGAALVFAIGTATTEGVKRLAIEGHFQLAQNIQNVLSDNRTWWAVAGATVLAEMASNKYKARKMQTDSLDSEIVDIPDAGPISPIDHPIVSNGIPVDNPII